MNDAHIYCTEGQLQDEFLSVMDLHKELYQILGINDYYMRLSTWDPDDSKRRDKFVDDPPAWRKSQALIRTAMEQAGMPFIEVRGEAAFYGPKIDVQVKTVTGREETVSTRTEIDFAVPGRLGLTYSGADGQDHTPWVIHRAPLGTHERFTAFLIELYGGAFPTWLAPVQVRLLTVVDRVSEYAQHIADELRKEFFRAEIDCSGERISKKVRNALTRKIPNVLILGEREAADGAVTLRRYGTEQQETVALDVFKERLRTAVRRGGRGNCPRPCRSAARQLPGGCPAGPRRERMIWRRRCDRFAEKRCCWPLPHRRESPNGPVILGVRYVAVTGGFVARLTLREQK